MPAIRLKTPLGKASHILQILNSTLTMWVLCNGYLVTMTLPSSRAHCRAQTVPRSYRCCSWIIITFFCEPVTYLTTLPASCLCRCCYVVKMIFSHEPVTYCRAQVVSCPCKYCSLVIMTFSLEPVTTCRALTVSCSCPR